MKNDTDSYFYFIDKKDLYFIVNQFEAYEGIAVIYTVDSKTGLNEFMVHESQKDIFLDIIEDFKDKGLIREVEEN